jgi:hypothetical protein
MFKKFSFIILSIFILLSSPIMAQMPGDDRNPTNTGKCINAGTVKSIDEDKRILMVNTVDYGSVTLKINDSTEIKIDNNFLNFEDLRTGDKIWFEGYWSKNLVSTVKIKILQGDPKSYLYGNSSSPGSNKNVQTSVTSANLSNLLIEKIIIISRGEKINLRVKLYNNGKNNISEPYAIILYIRPTQGDNYEQIKFWEEKGLKARNYLSRDYFIYGPSIYLGMNYFQVKADLIDMTGNVFYSFEQDFTGQDVL